jgi:hypothetical protein
MLSTTMELTSMRRWVRGLRARPWIRAAILLWLFSGILLVAFHQHRDAAAGHDCAICVAAHTPVTVSQTSYQVPMPQESGTVVAAAPARDIAAAFRVSFPSRAPPRS